jgi:FlaA1/EpsC-like NDP-sugar epimerase
MTIPEAVSLVLTAGGIAKGGEIFVLDMGEPVKIKDLAENLIRLSGFIPNEDIKIEYVGMRPGEKLFEELLISDENCQITENNKIYVENPMNLDADFFRKNMELLKVASQRNDSNEIRKILVNFVGLKEKN